MRLAGLRRMHMKREFTVQNKQTGKTIRGVVFLPEECNGSYPTVIFAHGFGSNYRELMHHGDGFCEAGIISVFFDFCGGGMASCSDGTMEEMTVLTEASDLEAVMEEVLTWENVDPGRLTLQGESMGGFAAAYVAGHHPKKVHSLVLWYPAFVVPDDSAKRFSAGEDTCFGMKLSPDFNKVAMEIDIYREIAPYRGPVLILHGDQDPVVPLSYSERALQVYEDASLVVIPGAGHGFDGEDSRMARERSAEWIKK